MAIIELTTRIEAPRERVFDLSRSIDAHMDSTTGTSERAVGGVTSGLIGLGEEVTWEARHFGIRQRLTVRITALERPSDGSATVMYDRFEFAAPLGILGRLAEWLFLTAYMRRFLIERNNILKSIAESEEWRRYLG